MNFKLVKVSSKPIVGQSPLILRQVSLVFWWQLHGTSVWNVGSEGKVSVQFVSTQVRVPAVSQRHAVEIIQRRNQNYQMTFLSRKYPISLTSSLTALVESLRNFDCNQRWPFEVSGVDLKRGLEGGFNCQEEVDYQDSQWTMESQNNSFAAWLAAVGLHLLVDGRSGPGCSLLHFHWKEKINWIKQPSFNQWWVLPSNILFTSNRAELKLKPWCRSLASSARDWEVPGLNRTKGGEPTSL